MKNDQDEADAPALSAMIRRQATYHAASPALRARVGRHLRTSAAPRERGWRQWLTVGAAFACGVIATWLVGVMPPNVTADPIESEVVAAHVRSLMPGHVPDVASSDRHTVKPWLSARLDFSPPVHDLRDDGFALTASPLDYIYERPVAALVYQRNQHVINVFIWPQPVPANAASSARSRKGFNTLAWNQAGMRYWVVSDVAAEELAAFAERLRQRNTEG